MLRQKDDREGSHDLAAGKGVQGKAYVDGDVLCRRCSSLRPVIRARV